jgi:hypothetical protein
MFRPFVSHVEKTGVQRIRNRIIWDEIDLKKPAPPQPQGWLTGIKD